MKTMTCKQLGGACDLKIKAETFDEMAKLSQQHGQEMHEQQEAAHLEAMGKMSELMKDPAAMQQWMAEKKQEFDALPENGKSQQSIGSPAFMIVIILIGLVVGSYFFGFLA